MKVPHKAHVALVDGERFILMRNTGAMFEPKLEFIAEPELETANFRAGVRHRDQAMQRTIDNSTAMAEFAHGAAVAEWLNAKALAGEIEQLVVVADPRTLGEMRQHYHKELQARIVGELAKDLTWNSPQEIGEMIAAA
jgi:protein required for attachment to host cells